MALKKDIELINNFGETSKFKDSLIKITKIDGNKDYLQLTIMFYKENMDLLTSKFEYFKPSLNGDNFIKQGYDYLKTLEEFKDAKDC